MFNSLDMRVWSVVGAILMWLGRVVSTWGRSSTAARRAKVDALAKAERRARLLTESLHDHRNLMLKSGQWTRETLPPFIKEELSSIDK